MLTWPAAAETVEAGAVEKVGVAVVVAAAVAAALAAAVVVAAVVVAEEGAWRRAAGAGARLFRW